MTDFMIDNEKYKTLSLHDKLIFDMIAATASATFNLRVKEIIYKTEGDMKTWDGNQWLSYCHFDEGFSNFMTTSYMLERLYKSEFNDFDEVKPLIKKASEDLANHALGVYGWTKRMAKGEDK